MLNLKHLIAAVALGTAMLVGPSAVNAAVPHHTTTVHPVTHKKKKHKPVHHKRKHKKVAAHVKTKTIALHAKPKITASHAKKAKPLAASGGRHSEL
jgi:hypothetical protein